MKRLLATLLAFLCGPLICWAIAYVGGAQMFTAEAAFAATMGLVLGVLFAILTFSGVLDP
ncbi:MAG: hypothetical protein RJA98_686 [Pseudomonadota bacterium]|jgi:uncharacterized RDD family membrane protein YckC